MLTYSQWQKLHQKLDESVIAGATTLGLAQPQALGIFASNPLGGIETQAGDELEEGKKKEKAEDADAEDEKEGDHDKADHEHDKKDDKDDKDDKKVPFFMKKKNDDDCCKEGEGEPWYARLHSMLGNPGQKFSNGLTEDMLLTPADAKDDQLVARKAQPGDVGYAPEGRVGGFW